MPKSTAVPKDTFINLPAPKRLRIEAALVREFAVHGYRKASLNTVVKSLGIAKGSRYQYFAAKESIFLYVFDLFTQRVKEMLQGPAGEAAEADLWQTLRQTMRAGVAFIDSYPDLYRLYLNVLFEHEVPRREELIKRVRLFSFDYFGPILAQGQAAGKVAPIPVARAVFMIDAVLDRFLQGYARPYLDGGLNLADRDAPALAMEIDCLIDTLKYGLTSGADRTPGRASNGNPARPGRKAR